VNVNDTCPNCLRRGVEPRLDQEDYDGNPHSTYTCPSCGHTWNAQRIAEPEPPRYAAYDDPDAWEAEDDFTAYDRARWGQ
jgi:ssDNA-binding Zn-finger/Zn-ribbon topoisomerase 1